MLRWIRGHYGHVSFFFVVKVKWFSYFSGKTAKSSTNFREGDKHLNQIIIAIFHLNNWCRKLLSLWEIRIVKEAKNKVPLDLCDLRYTHSCSWSNCSLSRSYSVTLTSSVRLPLLCPVLDWSWQSWWRWIHISFVPTSLPVSCYLRTLHLGLSALPVISCTPDPNSWPTFLLDC